MESGSPCRPHTVRFITCCEGRDVFDRPTVGDGAGTPRKTAATEVSCRGWPVAGTVFLTHCQSFQGTVESFPILRSH